MSHNVVFLWNITRLCVNSFLPIGSFDGNSDYCSVRLPFPAPLIFVVIVVVVSCVANLKMINVYK